MLPSMTSSRPRCVLALLFVAAAALIGCGVSSPGTPPGTPPVAPPAKTATPGATLGGNWLLFGTMPSFFPSATTATPGLAVSFDVENGKVSGAASLQQACTSGLPFAEVFENGLTGTVAPDGTFSTTVPAGFGQTFTITGTVPTTAGAPWTGSYVASNISNSALCPFNLTGKFTAVAVADLTGTFTGNGPLTSFNGLGVGPAPGAIIGLTQTLQQRGYVPSTSSNQVYSDLELGGVLQVTGISCFSKGTPSTFFSSLVIGNRFETNYDMDDGSQLIVEGVIEDTATTKLSVDFMVDSNGRCAGTYQLNAAPIILSR